MFDVGFWELCLVGLISLLVIGPEKLPKVARVAGFWVGKARNMVTSVQSEIKEELQAEEMRQILAEQQSELDKFQAMVNEGSQATDEVTESMKILSEQQENSINDSK